MVARTKKTPDAPAAEAPPALAPSRHNPVVDLLSCKSDLKVAAQDLDWLIVHGDTEQVKSAAYGAKARLDTLLSLLG